VPTRERGDDDGRVLALAFLLSILINFTLIPLLLWLAGWRFLTLPVMHPEETIVMSSAIRLDKQTRPLPRSIAPPKPSASQAKPQPHPPHPVRRQPPRHELARLQLNAPYQPPLTPQKPSLASQLAQQQEQFARTAKQLHDQNNPLSVATGAPHPSSLRYSYFDAPGKLHEEQAYAYLTPTKHWFDGNLSCYYTSYHTDFSGGGFEDGNIPWPICYPRNNDRMLPLDRPHPLPVPAPPPGFSLVQGTYLTPFLKDIFEGRVPH
jgi:hypothetical protein